MGASFGAVQPSETPATFDSVDLGVETIDGVIKMGAEAGWVWRRGGTTRIVLDRDVEVEVGGSILRARRGEIWLRKTGDGVYQLFGVFERLTSSDGSFSGERVPVRASVRLQEPISLSLGARFDAIPERKDLVEFMGRSGNLYQRRVLGLGAEDRAAPGSNLRWAPKELAPSGGSSDGVGRALPEPTVERGVSRVEKVLAATRGQDLIKELEAERLARIEAARRAQGRTDQQDQQGEDSGEFDRTAVIDPPEPIFRASGIFSVSIDGKIVIQGAQDAVDGREARPATITADGGVRMQYQDPATRRSMDLEAERAVIFLREGGDVGSSPSQINASEIEGIYLEGGVFAGNADWSVRSPKVYVDLVNDKMLMLDAVFWTVDQRTNMPLYLRADSVRQTSLGEFEAKKARIANSAFYEPDLSIGVSDLKVSVREEEFRRGGLVGLVGTVRDQFGGDGAQGAEVEAGSDLVRRVYVDGKNITLRLGSVPIFWVPRVKGDTDAFPLKEVRVGDSNRAGFGVKTRWDAYSLFGIDPIPGVKANLQLDYYTERGIAFGLSSNWNTERHRGSLFSYLVPDDNGTDITSSGREITRRGETRGIISFNDIYTIQGPWTLVTKGTYISDEAYISAFEERLGRETPDFDSMLRLERTSERNQFALELSGSPNDFFAAEHLLQSPGYAVDKIPEASFVSLGNDLLPENLPGVFDYQYEARIGAMRLRFSEVTAAEYGFNLPGIANNAFGTATDVSLADTQRLIGLDEDSVARFDTRHEIRGKFDAGAVRLTPFVVGRVTAYDTSFDTFSPNQTDDMRYWGAVGMTASTTLTKVNDSASSDFFDIHRIRHIVEPSLTVWQADSGYAAGDTPIFDDDVEGLVRGTMLRAAVDQTWQTKRGGPGRWRDADILKINTEYVWSSDRAGTSVIPDYYESRPELSNPGTYVGSDVVFSPTDVLAFSGSMVFDIDADHAARSSVGALIQHRPGLRSSIEYRDIRAVDATFLSGRVRYELTEKYTISTTANYNFDQGDFQNFFARVEREFQVGTFAISVNYNNIRSETSIGVVFRPFGTSGASVGPGGDFGN